MGSITAYSHGITVSAENALHDRIEVRLHGWTAYRQIMGENHRQTVQTFSPLFDSSNEGMVFIQPRGRALNRLLFRATERLIAGSRSPIPAMLPDGNLLLTGSEESEGINIVTGVVTANLNVTRYMRQQGFRRRLNLGPNQDIFKHSAWFRPSTDGEHSLDGNDNWLPANPAGEVTWSNEHAHAAPIRFLRSLHSRISAEYQRAANLASDMVAPLAPFGGSLKQVETYWELWHPEPLRFVRSLEREARQYCRQANARDYATTTDGQSLSLSLSIRADLRLKIYAKTNRRVRFELEHTFERSRRALPGRSFSSPAEVDALLSSLRTDAAAALNGFLAFMHPQAPAHLSLSRSPMALVCEIVQAVHGNYGQAQALLEALCIHGRLATTRNNPLRAAITRLVDNSIFQPSSPRSRSYVPSPVWRHAAETLTQDRLNTLFDTPSMAAIRQNQQGPPRPRQRARLPER